MVWRRYGIERHNTTFNYHIKYVNIHKLIQNELIILEL